MRFDVWNATDVGLKRETNQDSMLVDQELGLFIVADGMGGHSGGEVASAMAVEAVQQVVFEHRNSRLSPKALLLEAYKEACSRIYRKTEVDSPQLKGMGTTLVVALLRDDTVYIANVGDSRAYLFSKPHLWQLTEDHSLVNEHVRAGLLSEENISRFTGRNVITRSVGFERQVECDVLERRLHPGEMILLCSDGLSGQVKDERIREICHSSSPEKVVMRCIDEAKNNGGDDNVTVMLVHMKG